MVPLVRDFTHSLLSVECERGGSEFDKNRTRRTSERFEPLRTGRTLDQHRTMQPKTGPRSTTTMAPSDSSARAARYGPDHPEAAAVVECAYRVKPRSAQELRRRVVSQFECNRINFAHSRSFRKPRTTHVTTTTPPKNAAAGPKTNIKPNRRKISDWPCTEPSQ